MPRLRKREQGYFETSLGEDVVLMNASTGAFHALKGSGLVIWRLLDETADADELVERLCRRFDVDPERCRRDLDAFVERLAGAGFIERS